MRSYLDHNATTPLRPAARAAMLKALEVTGNASSIHAEGRAVRAALEDAREAVAQRLGVLPAMVVFTSGGSEANNAAIKGAAVERIILSDIEHPSVIEAAKASGKSVDMVPVTPEGTIDLDALRITLPGPPALVSIMAANNETGVIQPVREVVGLAAEHGALVHTDAVQAFGKIDLSFALLGADLMTLSAHKLGGPAGIGALVVRDGVALNPLVNGGGQELRRRAGTENLACAAGFASAAAEHMNDLKPLRDTLEAALEGAVIAGKDAPRLPNTTCFAVPGMNNETLLMGFDLDGIAVSSGSACSSGKVARSHVLAAMGYPASVCGAAIRVSLGWTTTEADVDNFISVWRKLLARHRNRTAA